MKLDFGDNVGMNFWEFYDSYFELIDNLLQSKKFVKFIVAFRRMQEAIKKYNVRFDAPRTYNLQEAFHPWMYLHLGLAKPPDPALWNGWKAAELSAEKKRRPKTVSIRPVTIG